MISTVRTLLAKELLLERRAPTVVPAMLLFSVSTFVVFHFALQRGSVEGELAAGVLCVTLLFAAILGAARLFVIDEEEGGFDAFLLAPVDRTAMLIAKALTFLTFLVAVELIAVPAFTILLLGPTLGAGEIVRLAGVLALADIGIVVIGTLVAGLAVRTRARDLIVPLIALPLLVPVVIGTARSITPLLLSGPAQAVPGRWLGVLGLYDLVFALVAFAVFDYLLDD
ncbi:MAG TPA: heme exporter protein CcmB [Solirubrobacteraceae bacterium]